ncbi:MAG TPA: sugar ABC transporter substrate-binding protein [Patescibacteria group bacterium]|nr:sugar ABC transporter substrate-binding protein [Patescibacteria group bacterium]
MEENINQPPQEYNPETVDTNPGPPIKKIVSLVIGLLVIILIVVLVFVVILPKFSNKEPKNVTLKYWSVFQDTAPLEAAAADFTRKNPNIKIVIENQDVKSLGKYVTRLYTRIDNGTGPDIFRYHNSWAPELKPYLLPLPQNVVKTLELQDKYYPVVENDLKIGGAYYGVPTHFDTLALFVNTEIFSKAGIDTYPTTWDDLVAVARQLTVKDPDGKIITSGAALGTYDNIAHASDIVSLLLVQNGANLLDLGGKTRQNSIDALDFYTSFAKGDTAVWDDTLENSKLAFAKGNVAMYIGYSWDIFEMKNINPNLQFAIVPVPRLPGRSMSVASYWVDGVSAKTKYPSEAFKFLNYIASTEVMQNLYAQESKTRAFGELYPRSDMASQLKSNTLIYPFVQQGKDAVSTIFSSDTYDGEMDDAMNNYLGNAVRSIADDSSSPDTAVDTLAKGVSAVITKYANQQSK